VNKYWTIKAKSEDTAEIYIYEMIGKDYFSDEGITSKKFAQDLKALGPVSQINLHLNSPGGNVWDGLGIYNVLKAHKAEKTIFIDGIAASVASAIACSGRVIMPENSLLMLHNPSGLCAGTEKDMLKVAEALNKVKGSLISIYQEKTRMSEQQISELMDEECWLCGSEAKRHGFADEVIEPVKMAALFDLSKFRNVPDSLKNVKNIGDKNKMENKTTDDTWRKDKHEERERAIACLAIGKEFKCPDLANQAIEDGWTEDQLRLALLAQIKAKGGATPGPSFKSIGEVLPAHGGKPFSRLGDQLQAVVAAARPGGKIDNRLYEVQNAASGANEAVPSEGGFLVQSDFTTELLAKTNETGVLAPLCWSFPVSGNGLEAPIIDETSRATGSRLGGVQVYRVGEGTEVTPKKPKFGKLELKLYKLMGVCYATDEVLEDATALEAIITRGFTEEIGFTVDAEIVAGTGAGECLGILNSNALVTVAKETGQLADTVQAENIINMYSRMHRTGKRSGVWLINNECWPQIFSLNMVFGTTAVPMFMPPGGLSQSPYGTLFGRPVIEIEQCEALGDKGDIIFADFNEYLLINKSPNFQNSIHVKFLTNEMTFRFTYRINGQPIWKSARTPYKGSVNATVSPFVTLQAR